MRPSPLPFLLLLLGVAAAPILVANTSSLCGSSLEASQQTVPVWLRALERDIAAHDFHRCQHISLTVALFPSRKLFGTSGRGTNPSDLVLPFRLENASSVQRGCGAAVVSTNIEEHAATARGWRTLYVADVNELSSNERQRRAHLVKVLAVHLFPHARTIHYGDVKCHTSHGIFPTSSLASVPACPLLTLIHPVRFMKPLLDEFVATEYHARERHEKADVFSDIARLQALYGATTLSTLVPMPDTMCMAFTGSVLVREFACQWFLYVLQYSMREQLSFNVALRQSRLSAEACACEAPCVAVDGVAFLATETLASATVAYANARAASTDWRRPRAVEEPPLALATTVGVSVTLPFVAFTLAPGAASILRWCLEHAGEKAVTAVFRSVLATSHADDDDLVLDIGANAGFYGIMSASLGWRTYLFDPQPTCQTYIAYAIAANNITSRALLVPHAVAYPDFAMLVSSATNCSGRFPISAQEQDPNYTGGWSATTTTTSTTNDMRYVRDLTVDVAALVGAAERVRLVKIDAEGNELNVLRSLAPLIVERRVGNIVVEVTPVFWARAGVRVDEIIEVFCMIVNAGYVGVTLAHAGPPLTTLESCTDVTALLHAKPSFTQVDVWFALDGNVGGMCTVFGEQCVV